MYPKLIENAFVKRTPEENQYILSFNNQKIHNLTTVNESAGMILALCDGKHSYNEIVSEINQKFDDEYCETEEMIHRFIDKFITTGLIQDEKEEHGDRHSSLLKGSSDIYLPTMISWELTDYCPLKCKHCYLGKKNNYAMSRFEIEKIFEIIDLSGVYQVQLTGGEVLTHPDVGYVVKNLVDRGITTAVSTSGYYFNDELFMDLQELKKVFGSTLRVSLDGKEKEHNIIRGKKDAYEKTVEFIKRAVERGIMCQVETCLINQPEEKIEELVDFVKKLGVNSMEIGLMLESGNAKENNLQSYWEPVKSKNLIKQLNKKYASNTFVIREPKKADRKNCGAGYILCHINAKMDVKPCPMLEIELGNLHNQGIEEIMAKYGKIFHDFEVPQKKHCEGCEKEELCKNCTVAGYCNHDKVQNCNWYRYAKETLKALIC